MGRPASIVTSIIALAGMLTAPAVVLASDRPVTGNAYDHEFVAIDGSPMPLSQWRGKVMLVVNTASFCGYTRQYTGLQALHERLEARGLVVIGVPSNDFGAQEPNANSEIATFCQGAFGVTFPLAEKQVVKGAGAHPFYRWARATLGETAAPRWNFHKYLVGRDGKLIAAFSTQTAPDAAPLRAAIERALDAASSP